MRRQRDLQLNLEFQWVGPKNFRVCGARKVWLQLNQESVRVARCTVVRLMRQLSLRGVRRARRWRTTISDEAVARPADLLRRAFTATRPDQLWAADNTFFSTWRGPVYVTLVIDVYWGCNKFCVLIHHSCRRESWQDVRNLGLRFQTS